jgi:hypothetical protein
MAESQELENTSIILLNSIEKRILTIRGLKVMLDADLAELYGATTKRLNEQVKRNRGRFPGDFMFRLTEQEKQEVVANCDHQCMTFQLKISLKRSGVWQIHLKRNDVESVLTAIFLWGNNLPAMKILLPPAARGLFSRKPPPWTRETSAKASN